MNALILMITLINIYMKQVELDLCDWPAAVQIVLNITKQIAKVMIEMGLSDIGEQEHPLTSSKNNKDRDQNYNVVHANYYPDGTLLM